MKFITHYKFNFSIFKIYIYLVPRLLIDEIFDTFENIWKFWTEYTNKHEI